jgi:hypothetical protein
MMRTESNKDCSEFVVSEETSLDVQKHARSNKTTMLDFSKAKRPISVISLIKSNSEQREQQLTTE